MLLKETPLLYAITDEVLTPDESVIEQVKTSLEAGIDILQYRNKTKSDAEVKEICIALQKLCSEYKVPFIIDDRPQLAEEIGADGLHIGKDDMPIAEARKIFTKGIIGVSCYGSVRKALEAEAEGASYVAFGSFFPSPTKPHSGIVSLSVIQKAKAAVKIPVCVIGGISIDNVDTLVLEKPDMISVVSAVYEGDIKSNVMHLLEKLGR
ncbi:MAG: thiamine phosphate synthase [Campylobacterales bacterium]|nr:thiamine phosphate synthase [Campylobacterales bacterium]